MPELLLNKSHLIDREAGHCGTQLHGSTWKVDTEMGLDLGVRLGTC